MTTKVMIVTIEYTDDYSQAVDKIRASITSNMHVMEWASLEDYTLSEALEYIKETTEEHIEEA